MALETTDLLVLERADYERILENGFDGELKVRPRGFFREQTQGLWGQGAIGFQTP